MPIWRSIYIILLPRPNAGSASGKVSTTANEHHAVEEVLWAMMAGNAAFSISSSWANWYV